MNEIMNILQNYGLGFASFIALIYFYNYVIKDMKETNEEVLKTLMAIESSLSTMNVRIEKLENRNKGE